MTPEQTAQQFFKVYALLGEYKQKNIPLLVHHYKALIYAYTSVAQLDCTMDTVATETDLIDRHNLFIENYKTKHPL